MAEEEQQESSRTAQPPPRPPRLPESPTLTSRPWCSRTCAARALTGPPRRSGGEGKVERGSPRNEGGRIVVVTFFSLPLDVVDLCKLCPRRGLPAAWLRESGPRFPLARGFSIFEESRKKKTHADDADDDAPPPKKKLPRAPKPATPAPSSLRPARLPPPSAPSPTCCPTTSPSRKPRQLASRWRESTRPCARCSRRSTGRPP